MVSALSGLISTQGTRFEPVLEGVALEVAPLSEAGRRYLRTKKEKLGHLLRGV